MPKNSKKGKIWVKSIILCILEDKPVVSLKPWTAEWNAI